MYCPKCTSGSTKVVDSRYNGNKKIRRRECKNCGNRWNTIEKTEQDMNDIQIKLDKFFQQTIQELKEILN